MNKIFCWGWTGRMECNLGCTSIEESWNKLSDDMREYLEEYDPEDCKVVNINDGKFEVYSIWEI